MAKNLKLIIDGVIYESKPRGGISRIFSEVLPRMCDMDNSLNVTLLTEGCARHILPRHLSIRHCTLPQVERYLRPGRLWKSVVPVVKRLLRQLSIGRGRERVWHSTYYTEPPGYWNGPTVVTVVDMSHERFPDLFNDYTCDQLRNQKREAVYKADAVICISENTRKDLESFYDVHSGKIHVIPLACSGVFRQLSKDGADLEVPVKRPFLLYVGFRGHPYKNFETLIRAYSLWRGRKDVDLVAVGSPWTTREKERLSQLGITKEAHLLSDVDDEKLCHLYNAAKAFVYPSLYEGFGIPLLEAMACGCPIIASRIPSTVEIAGEVPIYFTPTEVKELLDAFDRTLSEGKNTKGVQIGFERAKAYSWDRAARQTLDVYRRLLLGGWT